MLTPTRYTTPLLLVPSLAPASHTLPRRSAAPHLYSPRPPQLAPLAKNFKCECNPGWKGVDCGIKRCADACALHGVCDNGTCACHPGWKGQACQTMMCLNDCNNHGFCSNFSCICDNPFIGEDCGIRACPDNCLGRGSCTDGVCTCAKGFWGDNCGKKMCPGKPTCGGHGECMANGKCKCEETFTKLADCSFKACPNDCTGQGTCDGNGTCVCDAGFKGLDCSTKLCEKDCLADLDHGECRNGTCFCKEGWVGGSCDTKLCPGQCNGHGECKFGTDKDGNGWSDCQCEKGFTGADCNTRYVVHGRLLDKGATDAAGKPTGGGLKDLLKVGAAVEAKAKGSAIWTQGKMLKINPEGTVEVEAKDGTVMRDVPVERLRKAADIGPGSVITVLASAVSVVQAKDFKVRSSLALAGVDKDSFDAGKRDALRKAIAEIVGVKPERVQILKVAAVGATADDALLFVELAKGAGVDTQGGDALSAQVMFAIKAKTEAEAKVTQGKLSEAKPDDMLVALSLQGVQNITGIERVEEPTIVKPSRGKIIWSPATVLTLNADGTFDVSTEDKARIKSVTVDRLKQTTGAAISGTIMEGAKLQVAVEVAKESKSGVVTAANPDGSYDVLFDDGTKQKEVRTDQMKDSGRPAGSNGPAATDLVVGSRVEARPSAKGAYTPCRVVKVNPDSTYDITFDDDTKLKKVPLARLRSAGAGAAEFALVVGSAVQAKLGSSKAYMSGSVAEQDPDGADSIAFNNGMKAMAISLDNIIPGGGGAGAGGVGAGGDVGLSCFKGFGGADCSTKLCKHNCTGHGACTDGVCFCAPGWTGKVCQRRGCLSNCYDNGQCTKGVCHCNRGFKGKLCEIRVVEHGECDVKTGKCACHKVPGAIEAFPGQKWAGNDCAGKTCPRNCSNHGQCRDNDGTCLCEEGYTGSACNVMACKNECSYHGRCTGGKCACDVGFRGLDCSEKYCAEDCSGNGDCVDKSCVCGLVEKSALYKGKEL